MELNVCVLFLLFPTIISASSVQIVVFEILKCENPIDTEIKFTSSLEGDPKVFVGSIDVPFDIEGEDLFHLKVNQLTDGNWRTVKEMDGDIATYVGEFLAKAWDKAKEVADPKIVSDYGLPQGSYVWSGLQLSSDDVEVPSGMIGRFKMELTLFKDEDPVFCRSIDLETSMEK